MLVVRATGHQDYLNSPPKCLFPQVEGLMDDIDFKAKVTRAEFEDLCADLFERVPQPVKDALSTAEMTMVSSVTTRLNLSHSCMYVFIVASLRIFHVVFSHLQNEIEQVILVGGATRVPKVQEVLLKAVEK